MFDTPTPNMAKFIQRNNDAQVVSAARLTPDGRPVYGHADFMSSDRCRYRFTDGSQITLKDSDQVSAPDFKPKWAING